MSASATKPTPGASVELKPDSRHRLAFGKLLAAAGLGDNVRLAARWENGIFTLRPMVSVPASEAWLYANTDALASVMRGLEQAGRGELEDLSPLLEDETEG
jgi:hypothetical protein